MGGFLGIIELGQVISANIAGTVPDFVTKTGHPTGVVYILDLGAVVPLMLFTGAWLRYRRPWGYVTAAILLVKGITVGLGLASANLYNYLDRRETDGPLPGLWIAIAAGSLLAEVLFLKTLRDAEGRDETLVRSA